MSTAFTAGEQNWQARLGKLRDVVRQELVARQLERELPPAPVRIVDFGCGQGTQALRLARRGYDVTGVDASADLLARFERDLAAEPAGSAAGCGSCAAWSRTMPNGPGGHASPPCCATAC